MFNKGIDSVIVMILGLAWIYFIGSWLGWIIGIINGVVGFFTFLDRGNNEYSTGEFFI